MNVTLRALAEWAGGRLHGEDAPVRGVAIDSRRIAPGELFVALPGNRVDGHDFVAAAAAAGAAGALVARRQPVDLPQIEVADPRRALGAIAAAWRARFDLPLVAVTGSNGKTTVKEMIAAILSRRGPTLVTEGNLNNDLGVPLTLLRLRPEHRYAVVEMGANHAGEIAYLTGLARPAAALITNAGPAHLEGFGTLDGVAHAKGEIFQGVPEGGWAVLNADDRYFGLWRRLAAHCRQVAFALDAAEAEVRGRLAADGDWLLETPLGVLQLPPPLLGRHNLRNAAAAAAAAWAVGAAAAAIEAGLRGLRPVPGRLCLLRGRFGTWVIDDSYNANPASLEAALEVLAERPGRGFLVLGDMAELGPEGRALHARMGQRARAAGLVGLFALGELAAAAAEAFGPGGEAYEDVDALVAALQSRLGAGDHVLVKGSRRMRMERVVAALAETVEE